MDASSRSVGKAPQLNARRSLDLKKKRTKEKDKRKACLRKPEKVNKGMLACASKIENEPKGVSSYLRVKNQVVFSHRKPACSKISTLSLRDFLTRRCSGGLMASPTPGS